jgi:hypothetical protein
VMPGTAATYRTLGLRLASTPRRRAATRPRKAFGRSIRARPSDGGRRAVIAGAVLVRLRPTAAFCLAGAILRGDAAASPPPRRLRANGFPRLATAPVTERRFLWVVVEARFGRTPPAFLAPFATRDFGRFCLAAEAAACWRPAAARAFLRTVLFLRRVAATLVGLLPIVIPGERAQQR